MKIIFFSADYIPTGGGIATYVHELVHNTYSHPLVTDTKLIVFGNKNPRKEQFENGLGKLYIKTYSSINFLYTGIMVFFYFINNFKYDIFHSLNLFPLGFWTVFWGKIFNKKTIITFYGTDACDTKASTKTLFLKKWSIVNSSLPLTISDFTKTQVEKRYNLNPNLIKFIHPIVPEIMLKNNKDNFDIDKIKSENNIEKDDFVILTVSRLVKRKGTDDLIKAIGILNDNNIKLLIIGDGKERENLEKLIIDNNLSKNVRLLGKVKDITPYYHLADVFALTSYIIENDGDFEGFGLVMTEAQSYGLPVIGTKSGGIPETFNHMQTGILLPERDIKAIANAIKQIKDDDVLQKTMSDNTKDFLINNFGYKNSINKYIELCKSL